MKIAITGGLGFIGSCFSQLAHDQHELVIIDKLLQPEKDWRFHFYQCNICDREALIKACNGQQAIVHLAAEHRDDVRPASLYDDVNIEGARNVCLAAESNNINTIVFTSSVAVYPLGTPANEQTAPKPFNDYGRTKLAAEKVLIEWQQKEPDQRVLVIIRPTVVFGENNRGNVYNLLRQLVKGPFLMVGSGKNKKSMSYVANVVDFLLSRLTLSPGQYLYNYADKPDLSMNELIAIVDGIVKHPRSGSLRLPRGLAMIMAWGLDRVADITGRSFPVSQIRIKKFTANTIYHANELVREGYQAPHDMMAALQQTIQHEFPESCSI